MKQVRADDSSASNDTSLIARIRKIKIQTRLIAAFLLVSLLPVFFLATYSYSIYSNSIQTKLAQAARVSTQLLNNNFLLVLSDYSDYISVLSLSDEIQTRLSPEFRSDTNSVYESVKNIKDMLGRIPNMSSHVLDACIIDRNNNLVYSNGYLGVQTKSLDHLLEYTDLSSPKDCLGYMKTSIGRECLVLSRKIYSDDLTSKHIGYIALFLDPSVLSKKTLPVSLLGDGANLLLMDAVGTVIVSQDKSLIDQSLVGAPFYQSVLEARTKKGDYTSEFSTEKELIIANYSNAYNVYMIATIPNTYITEETMNIRLMIYMLTVPLLLLCVLLIALIYRSIMIPINRITQVCSVDEQKPLNRLVGDSSPDEIGFLARTIDEKTTKNLKLLDELDQNDRRKRELELEMLQYQINPHFLFNTLNTFKWIAALNNAPVLSSGLSSLAGLLKSTLMKKDEFIPLREEISNLEYYCVIQDLRYVGRFHVNFAIDEHTRECQIPRFILQPLVENAIVHGIGNIDAVMEIDVSSKIENEVLHLHIDDNGVGFDVENVMDQAREHFTGIGLSNVDERLKLHYGEKFGLTITSRKGNGTCCHITLPVAEQKRQRNSDA